MTSDEQLNERLKKACLAFTYIYLHMHKSRDSTQLEQLWDVIDSVIRTGTHPVLEKLEQIMSGKDPNISPVDIDFLSDFE